MGWHNQLLEEEYVWPGHASRWWRDLVRLDDSNWLNSEIVRLVGNGENTIFWEVPWRGDRAFWDKYPRLFSLSNQKEENVGELAVGLVTDVDWGFSWRHPLFVWEEEMLLELKEDLGGFKGSQEEDVWRWRLEDDGRFSVKSLYRKMEGLMLEDESVSLEEVRVFSRKGSSAAPSKVAAFSWKLLHNRIPTKANLVHRQVLAPKSSLQCVMCEGLLESANHLFLHCSFAMKVWDEVMRWLGFHFVTPPNLFFLWDSWDGVSSNKKIRKGLRMIWHAVVWSIWKA